MVKEVKRESSEGNEKLCSMLSYILIGIIWYFADDKMRKSGFAKYHAKQGLVLLIAAIVWGILLSIIFQAFAWQMLLSGGVRLFQIISWLNYIPLIWVIIGVINVANNNEKPLPLIGKFAEKLSF